MKNYFVLVFLILITACSMPPKRGETPEEIDYNLIVDLYNSGRFGPARFESFEYKRKYPHSKYIKDVDYYNALIIDRNGVRSPQFSYSTWLDFQKMHPKYKKEIVKEKLDFYKDKKDPPIGIGFIELSSVMELSRDSHLDNLNENNIYGFDFSYYSHQRVKRGLGFYFNISSQNYDKINIADFKDFTQTFISLGVSYKYKLIDDKLVSYFSLGGSMINNSLLPINEDLKSKEETSFGAHAKLSFDVLVYQGGYSLRRNNLYYLTFGVSAYYAPSVKFDEISIRDTTNIAWFVGFKL